MTTPNNVNTNYTVVNIPVREIYRDDEFNCRGEITTESVLTLAEDIKSRGLDSPITVVPLANDPIYRYKIVAGHRRYTACRYLKWETIPCIVRADMDMVQATIFNIKENLERKDLNILQEAKAIQDLAGLGLTPKRIGQIVGRGTQWVNIRIALLLLPKAVQEDAALGLILPREIDFLANLMRAGKPIETVLRMAARAKDKRVYVSSISKRLLNEEKRAKTPPVTHVRPKVEIEEVMNQCLNALKGPSLASWALGWVLGTVTTKRLLEQIQHECKLYDYPYVIPQSYIFTEKDEREKYGITD